MAGRRFDLSLEVEAATGCCARVAGEPPG